MVQAHTSHFPCEEHFNKGFGTTLEYSGGRCQRAGRRADLVGMAAMPSLQYFENQSEPFFYHLLPYLEYC